MGPEPGPGDGADERGRREDEREVPNRRWPGAAAATSGIAWTRSVPTGDEALIAG